jgi:L-lactate dehydrogenase complex protein LldG
MSASTQHPVGDARAEVLARIRSALGADPPVPDVVRGHRTRGEHPPGSEPLLELLRDRLVDYKAGVHLSSADGLAATIAEVLQRVAPQGLVLVPAGLPQEWTAGRDVLRDDGTASTQDLDSVAAVVTGCAAAVAETGTLILDAGPGQGRRALTLVPDVHVCVVRADQVVQTVPEAVARLDARRPQTWISGPSATSDIELQRVEGVHGPRTLEVVVVTS